jgi:hypothetical protein
LIIPFHGLLGFVLYNGATGSKLSTIGIYIRANLSTVSCAILALT